jgi:hypothetical protein
LQKLPPLPPAVRSAALDVAREIGVSQRQTPKQVVAALVSYFRGFAPSDATPKATRGAQLYEELSLSRKGVCRHRAYAFTVTALGLGIPTRMVRNEAHAWVEVYDGVRFHRVDLGGAAGRMELDPRTADHLYRPPQDTFSWPEGSESGQGMLADTLDGAPGAQPGAPGAASSASGRTTPVPSASAPGAAASAAAPQRLAPIGDDRPHATVDLKLEQLSSVRGGVVHLKGSVEAAGEPCLFSRVDVSLRDASGVETWLGAFPTDESGRLEGRVTVPFDIDVGDYKVIARTPGTGRCGSSR